jgi:hypothetical protein
MKLPLIAAGLFGALASLSNGAVYSITNLTGDSAVGITEQDGMPGAAITIKGFNTIEGFGSIGVVNEAALLSATTAAQVYASFTAFGASGNSTNFGATTLGNNGTITMGNADYDIDGPGSSFAGKNIYLLFANVTNAGAITSTTQFLILKMTTETFDASDDVPASVALTFDQNNTTLLMGGFNNFQFKTRTSDTTTGPAWNTVAVIPEPSVALLGLIGAVGFLRRRR